MNKTLGALLCSCVLLVATSASAREVDGKWGLGYESTLTSLGQDLFGNNVTASGLAARVYVGHWALEAVLGASYHNVPKGSPEIRAAVSAGGLYNVFRSPSANLAAGVRGVFGLVRNFLPRDATNETRAGLQHSGTDVGFTVEFPLRAEYFFSDNFAISGAVGPVLELGRTSANPLTGSSSFGIDVFRGGFSGGVGFMVYFR